MACSSSGFICICPPKSIDLDAHNKLHRADHAAELHAELEFVDTAGVINDST